MSGIQADTRMHELLTKHPRAKKVLEKHGMLCQGCKGSDAETIKRAAQNHGIPLDTLLAEIKEAVKA